MMIIVIKNNHSSNIFHKYMQYNYYNKYSLNVLSVNLRSVSNFEFQKYIEILNISTSCKS